MTLSAEQIKAIVPTERDLCLIFIEEMNEQPGWTCYPETCGFDILVVHDSGRQIGVEAKLHLNSKVADQILPADSWHRYGGAGPDHRLVIVRSITDANAGIAKMLQQLGVAVWELQVRERAHGHATFFQVREHLRKDDLCREGDYCFQAGMFDWNPTERLIVPDAVPTLDAGIPAPIQMTPWKMAAVRVLARLRVQGSIAAKEIVAEGCSPSIWTQRWLARGSACGQWVETEAMPAFDRQHPELYEVALAKARALYRAATTADLITTAGGTDGQA